GVLSADICKTHEIAVEFIELDAPGDLSRDISLCLFRVTQEALHNAVKYGGNSKLEVEIAGYASEVRLEVRDWGEGFDVEDAKQNGGLGLVSMQERVNLVDGRFSIE